ncbi:MAG: DUF6249 domain-containing protein [Chloroflexota bacterium]
MEDSIVAITIPFMVMFIVATVAVVFVRMLKHREIMQYAKQGMYPPYQVSGRMVPTKAMKKGVTTAAVGLGLTFGLLFIGFGPWLIAGLIPLFVGMGMMTNGWMEMRAGIPQHHDEWGDEMLPAEKQPIPFNEDIDIKM